MRAKVPVRTASRMRRSMNQARPPGHAERAAQLGRLIEFLALESTQTAGSHPSQPSGESPKMVPVLSENWPVQPFTSGCARRPGTRFRHARGGSR